MLVGWGNGFKLLWLTKTQVYCGFGASKGDTLCGIVFWSFCKGSVIENHTCLVSVSFCVLCQPLPLPQELQQAISL